MNILAWCCSFFVIVFPLAAQEPARIVTRQDGVVNRHEVAGQLAATQPVGCIALSLATNKLTPPDLYHGVRECIARDNYDAAVGLFALAGIYSSFDTERVTDQTAHQGATVLILNTFAEIPLDKKQTFQAAVRQLQESPAVRNRLCAAIKKIGMPDYYPNYMILHGTKAFTGDPHAEALVSSFDGPKVWTALQSSYLKCAG
ncbi:MAG: hypothetical protein HQL90_03090 [Magnetococcales bacterium]|nr:hypothetical protein [Magnetococcales bacterium]